MADNTLKRAAFARDAARVFFACCRPWAGDTQATAAVRQFEKPASNRQEEHTLPEKSNSSFF
jgi:hypothetical protein